MSNEQWISGGDCSICRRAKYCSKPCKESKRRAYRDVVSTTMSVFSSILSGINRESREEE